MEDGDSRYMNSKLICFYGLNCTHKFLQLDNRAMSVYFGSDISCQLKAWWVDLLISELGQ